MCSVDLRVRRSGATLARNRVEIAGGRTRTVALRLTRSARRRLALRGSMRVTLVAVARDVAANQRTSRLRIDLLGRGG
jgi:hypothetical protein